MNADAFIDWFIHPDRKKDSLEYKKARLFVRASLLTSLFSNSYIWLSVYFEFYLAVKLMIFNVLGFLILSILAKSKIPIKMLGHVYVFVGAFAVVIIAYFSGGIWSAVYPWIISIPVLALLVVDRKAGIWWGIISFSAMVWMGILALQGVELPLLYNTEMKTLWFVTVVPGLLLIIMVVSMVFESTQRKAIMEIEHQKNTIKEQSNELEKLLEEKDHIIRILAHDMKNPLVNISTIAQLLPEEKDTVQRQQLSEMIGQIATKSQRLLDKVLNMAILEQGGIRLNLEPLKVSEVIHEAVNELKEQANQKHISIVTHLENTSAQVMADKVYLLLIFENLLSNALKFSNKETTITIRLETEGHSVLIRVQDEGPGVKAEEQERLFEKFTKLSARPTANENSTGLGLSLVKTYVEQINGTIRYEQGAATGATFVVELPILERE